MLEATELMIVKIPFKEGYLLTWINPNKPREKAIEESVQRTNKVLEERASTSPIIERIHLIRDQVIETTKLKDLLSFDFIQSKLDCSLYEAEEAVNTTLQLYPDVKEIKPFFFRGPIFELMPNVVWMAHYSYVGSRSRETFRGCLHRVWLALKHLSNLLHAIELLLNPQFSRVYIFA